MMYLRIDIFLDDLRASLGSSPGLKPCTSSGTHNSKGEKRMSKKHIKLGSDAGPSADTIWTEALPAKVELPPGTPGTDGAATRGQLIVNLPGGKQQKLAIRTKEGDLLLEFDV
jgi:hypothetical protein